MRKITPLIVFTLCGMAFWPRPVSALNMSMSPKPKFDYKDASGKRRSVDIIDKYQPKRIVHPFAKLDPKIDPKLCRAATIAEERAHAHSHSLCWRFVKEALVAAGVLRSRPTTMLAKQAGQELLSNCRFQALRGSNPYAARMGSVLVCGAS